MGDRSDLKALYARHIRALPAEDRLELIAVMARDLAFDTASNRPHDRSILELEGLGADIWQMVDAQTYVDHLREEWDHRP